MTNKFNDGRWSRRIDVADFVYSNITPYEGDASFLAGATDRTKRLWNKCLEALAEERANGGVRAIDAKTISTITSHAAGYIDKDDEPTPAPAPKKKAAPKAEESEKEEVKKEEPKKEEKSSPIEKLPLKDDTREENKNDTSSDNKTDK